RTRKGPPNRWREVPKNEKSTPKQRVFVVPRQSKHKLPALTSFSALVCTTGQGILKPSSLSTQK
uniref:Uncharacterized protein n=1 Tax=Solanum lycopersicum TaxID=4081 RepID=A0A3Q7IIF1_SOLLC